jgi:RNA polymerase sigma-70 factor (ECF subfamily)
MATTLQRLHTFRTMSQLHPINGGQRATYTTDPASDAATAADTDPEHARQPRGVRPGQPNTDTELMARFERDAIPMIDELYASARRLTRCRADAEDLLQDAMLKAYADFASFQPGTHLRAWLYRIMHNTWINAYHKNRRRPIENLSAEIADWQLIAHHRHAATPLRSAELEALEALPDNEIARALSGLPNKLQAVIYHADIEGLHYREIADIAEIPLGTVMSRLHRGRRLLRELLADVARQRGFATSEIRQAG